MASAQISSSNKSQFFLFSESSGKQKYTKNDKYQKELISSLLTLIECIYNQYSLSFGFSDVDSLLSQLKDSISSTQSSLLVSESRATDEIGLANEKISRLQSLLDSLNSGQAELPDPVAVQVYMDINKDFLAIYEKLAVLNEFRAKYEKEIYCLSLYISYLNYKKKKLSEWFREVVEGLLIELNTVEDQLTEIKTFEKQLIGSQSLTQFMMDPEQLANCSRHMMKLDSFLNVVAEINCRIGRVSFEIKYFQNFEEVHRTVIQKYSLLEYERTIEPILKEDLKSLNNSKVEFENKIKKYSPYWLCKQYEKNLNLMLKDLNKIITSLSEIQISYQKQKNKPISQLKISQNEKISLKKLTIDNYKSIYISEPEQKLIIECIKTLYYNLEVLNNSKNTIDLKYFNIIVPAIYLNPIVLTKSSIKSSKAKDFYKLIIEKINFLSQSLIEVSKSLNELKLIPIEGFTQETKNKSKSNHSSRIDSERKTNSYGVIDVLMVKPPLRMYFFNLSQTYAGHESFKGNRKSLNETLEKIKFVERRINYKQELLKELDYYESQLKIYEPANIPENNLDVLASIRFREILKYTKSDKIFVNYENLALVFSSIFSRLNIKNNSKISAKLDKSFNKNSISPEDFIKVLHSSLIESGKNHEKLRKGLYHYSQIEGISAQDFCHFIVNEQIVGSYLSETDKPQVVVEGRINEDFRKSLFLVAKDFSLISVFQQEPLKKIKINIGKFHDLQESLEKVIQEHSKKLGEFFSNFKKII